jgi:DNA-binding CsgD family transcriptional regulator/tetratricopeptide (TPR) repeat protein
MQEEHVNLRAALEFCLADPAEVGAGFEMLPALGLYWSVSGSLGEGRRFLERALSAKADPAPGRAKALWVASWVAANQGDLSAAEQAAEESRRLAQRYGDQRAFGHASVYLGMARMVRGDADSAERLFHEALATAGKANLVGTGAMRRLAEVARRRGDIDAANASLREIVAICQAHGEYWEQASALWSLAILAWEHGDVGQTTALSRESLALRAMFGDRVGIAQCLEVLAWAAAGGGAYDRAATLLGAADAVWKAVGASLFAYLAGFREECESIVRQALGEGAFKQTIRKGGVQLLADMVADALDDKGQAASLRPTGEVRLTAREFQIADLVADGLSNREIAAKMVIAQRTAEGHVEHILAKLGFTSRVQIAAWVTQRRPGSVH